jgi:hypothetical protein
MRALRSANSTQRGDEQIERALASALGKLVDDVGCLADPVAALPAGAEQRSAHGPSDPVTASPSSLDIGYLSPRGATQTR